MTDRYNTLTVILDGPVRTDDAQVLIDAIQQLRGVAQVHGNLEPDVMAIYTAKALLRREIFDKLGDLL